MVKILRRWVVVVCAAVMAFALAVPSAWADGLDDAKKQADAQASQAQSDVDSAAAALNAANNRVRDAQARVAAAQQALDQARAGWEYAQDIEAQKAIELYEANTVLEQAQQQVADGQAKIDDQKDAINAYARAIVQDNLPLVNVAMLINSDSTATLANRVQWSDTVLTTNQVDLDQLRQIQAELLRAQKLAADAQQAADQAKQAADEQVEVASQAQQAAEQAERDVESALADEQAAQDQASHLLADSQVTLDHAKAVQADVNAQILERARKEEEERQAELKRQEEARQAELKRQEAARKAEEERQAQAAANASSGNSSGTSGGSGTSSGSSGGSSGSTGGSGSGGGNLSPSQAQSTAYGMIQSYGWGDSQFQCLVKLWNRESGWRWNAENPYSGAYGIPQSLPASKIATAGSDWRTNAVTQMRWGLSYISGRYGTPCGAWAHSEETNWY